MKRIILPILFSVLLTASAAQAVTVTGYYHPDQVSADITASLADSTTLRIEAKNTSAYGAVLMDLLFPVQSGVTLSVDSVTYLNPDSPAPNADATGAWSVGAPKPANIFNAPPMNLYSGLNAMLYIGPNFNGGNANLGLAPDWTAVFLLSADKGTLTEFPDLFVARFQRVGEDGEDSDFAHPTPIPGAIWLLGSGIVGLIGIRRRLAA